MKITFLGAAGEVTGSQHLLELDDHRILLDCGLFQGPRMAARLKNLQFLCRPKELDAVILSHAHTDHCGNLPGLYRAGFRGPVFCTHPTADIAELMLMDSARLQVEEAKAIERKQKPGGPPVPPLFDESDVRGLMRLFEPLAYHEWHHLGKGFRLRFSDAGHILGSAITELHLGEGDELRRVTFSGDLGRRDMPLLRDPEPVGGCDVLITESTYGSRIHPPTDDLKTALVRIMNDALDCGGRIIIPAFSLGRTQQLVYLLNELHNEGKLPGVPIFVDSPLARSITSIFRRHSKVFDEDYQAVLESDPDPFSFPGLTWISTREESMALNKREGTFMVISASGMCEGGRVVHHLRHAVEGECNVIVLIGYQAAQTLGRQLSDRLPVVRIQDHRYPLKARVEHLEGLSSHADLKDLTWWFEHMHRDEGIGQAFLVHGEPESASALAVVLRELSNEEPIVPAYGETYEV